MVEPITNDPDQEPIDGVARILEDSFEASPSRAETAAEEIVKLVREALAEG